MTVKSIGNNNATYPVHAAYRTGRRNRCPYYSRWTGMLARVTFPGAATTPTTVCREWTDFMAFQKWMTRQEWQHKSLYPFEHHYSPSTVAFISSEVEHWVTPRELSPKNNQLPTGVFKYKKPGYIARISIEGSTIHLGTYPTISQADKAYRRAKAKRIYLIAAKAPLPLMNQLHAIALALYPECGTIF